MLGISSFISQIKAMRREVLFYNICNTVLILTTGLLIWNGLKVLMNNNNPVVVVLSGSMEPGYRRGDLLLVSGETTRQYAPGDVVVFPIADKAIPIVHRILRAFTSKPTAALYDGVESDTLKVVTQKVLTKGDNNSHSDNFLYPDRNILTSCIDLDGAKTGMRNGIDNIATLSPDDCLRKSDIAGRILGYFPGVGYATILMRENRWVRTILFGGLFLMAILGHSE